MTKILDNLLKNTYSVEELNQKLASLKKITPDTNARHTHTPLESASLKDSHLITLDIEGKNRYELLDEVEREIETLPVVFITLATKLPEEDVVRLGKWFRKNVDTRILLEVYKDPKIVGGCKIIWQGAEGDFSLRKKLERNREKLPELISKT